MEEIFNKSLDDETVASSLVTSFFNGGTIRCRLSQKTTDERCEINTREAQDGIEKVHRYLLHNDVSKLNELIDFAECELYNQQEPVEGEQAVKNLVANLFANTDKHLMETSEKGNGERILRTFAANWTLFGKLVEGVDKEPKGDVAVFYDILDMICDTIDADLKSRMEDFFKKVSQIVCGNVTIDQMMRHSDKIAQAARDMQIEEAIDGIATRHLKDVSESFTKGMSIDKLDKQGEGITIKKIRKYKNLDELNAYIKKANGDYELFVKCAFGSYFGEIKELDKRFVMANTIRGVRAPISNYTKTTLADEILRGLLTGVGPAMAKILQGIPKEAVNEDLRKALEAVKVSMPPIEKEIVQAEFLKLINDNPSIARIKVLKSLGSASVGQAFSVQIFKKDNLDVPIPAVVKIIRPDAGSRLRRELPVMKKAAEKIPGFWMTYQNQMKIFEEELDLRREGAHIKDGAKIYDGNWRRGTNPVGSRFKAITFDREFYKGESNGHSLGNPDWGEGKQETVRYRSVSLISDIKPTKSCLVMENNGPDTIAHVLKRGKSIAEALKLGDFDQESALNALGLKDEEDAREELKRITFRLKGTSLALRQISRDWANEALYHGGFYHGDLHAGNMIVDENGHVILIDFGNCMRMSSPTAFKAMMFTLAPEDAQYDRSAEFFLKIYEGLVSGEHTRSFLADEDKRLALEAKLHHVFIMDKGNKVKDCVKKLSAALGILQSEGLEVPVGLFNFMQSLTRLWNTTSDVQSACGEFEETLTRFGIQVDNPEFVQNETVKVKWDFMSDMTAVFTTHIGSAFKTLIFGTPRGYFSWIGGGDSRETTRASVDRHEVVTRALMSGSERLCQMKPTAVLREYDRWCQNNADVRRGQYDEFIEELEGKFGLEDYPKI